MTRQPTNCQEFDKTNRGHTADIHDFLPPHTHTHTYTPTSVKPNSFFLVEYGLWCVIGGNPSPWRRINHYGLFMSDGYVCMHVERGFGGCWWRVIRWEEREKKCVCVGGGGRGG